MESNKPSDIQIQVKKQKKFDPKELRSLSKEELIDKIQSLEAQNVQLKHILARSLEDKKPSKKNQKPFDFSKCTFRHVLLKFYYLGWDCQGYATQEDTNNTIEYNLFEALTRTCLIENRNTANYHRCGRTDKGVSAFGQVISIDLRSRLAKENQHEFDKEIEYCKILNKVLPENIQCVAWCPAPENFSSRFDCKSRSYKYFFPKGTLDIEKMKAASSYLIGSHDFRNFCKMDVGNGVVNFIRNIYSIDINLVNETIESDVDDTYHMYVVTIKAQSFLWHQIRCIMGVLFLIGEQKEEPEVIKELLDVDKNPRKPDYNMASEVPLNLYFCEYELNDQWQYDKEALSAALNKLRVMWCLQSVKASMIKTMLSELQGLQCDTNLNSLSDSLINGVKSRTYIPLMQRKKCESLESRIDHYVKRNRLIVKDSTESVE